MPGRFPLFALLLAVALGGCATASEDRLAMLESAVMDLQTRDIRLATLEETVAGLVARQEASGEKQEMPARPSPRRISPDPVKPAPVPEKPAPATAKNNNAIAPREYQTALSTLEAGQPQTALTRFTEFLSRYPGHALAPNAVYWLGECHYSMRQYESAILVFKDVVAQFSSHEKAAAAMLKAGYSYAQLGDVSNARFYLETLVRDFPSSQPAALARTRLASL